jgi:hypothetical protein
MSRTSVANFCAIPAALFLLAIGILHGFVNVSGMQRAIARGDVPQRLGASFVANAAFSGVAIVMLGALVFVVLPGLRMGSRQAARVAFSIGVFIGGVGIAGFVWAPTKPIILIFLFFGTLLAAPLRIWRNEFSTT